MEDSAGNSAITPSPILSATALNVVIGAFLLRALVGYVIQLAVAVTVALSWHPLVLAVIAWALVALLPAAVAGTVYTLLAGRVASHDQELLSFVSWIILSGGYPLGRDSLDLDLPAAAQHLYRLLWQATGVAVGCFLAYLLGRWVWARYRPRRVEC